MIGEVLTVRPPSLTPSFIFLTPTVSACCLVFFSSAPNDCATPTRERSGGKCGVAEEERVFTARSDVLKAAVREILLVLLVRCHLSITFFNAHT